MSLMSGVFRYSASKKQVLYGIESGKATISISLGTFITHLIRFCKFKQYLYSRIRD